MKTWSDGVLEPWSVGTIQSRALSQYWNIRILRQSSTLIKNVFYFALDAMLFALGVSAQAQQTKVPKIGWL
jgi:hypothetical protein